MIKNVLFVLQKLYARHALLDIGSMIQLVQLVIKVVLLAHQMLCAPLVQLDFGLIIVLVLLVIKIVLHVVLQQNVNHVHQLFG